MALASLAVFLRRALTAPIAVFVVLQLLDQFELIPDDYERLVSGLIFGIAIAALARAAATSVLAPDDPRSAGRSSSTIRARNGCPRIWSGAGGCSAPS